MASLIRRGDAAKRLAYCFAVDKPLPFPIPVWVADVNCESEPYAAEVWQLRSAEGTGGEPSYADLSNGKKVFAVELFFRGEGYVSPEPMVVEDCHGSTTQQCQLRP